MPVDRDLAGQIQTDTGWKCCCAHAWEPEMVQALRGSPGKTSGSQRHPLVLHKTRKTEGVTNTEENRLLQGQWCREHSCVIRVLEGTILCSLGWVLSICTELPLEEHL